jgi:hypothetical protein
VRATRLNPRSTAADVATLATPGHGVLTVNEAPVTPLRFGAVGNGSTLDDGAFTAMMAALPAAGAHVYLPSGYTFLLSQPITLTGNASWSGGGATARIVNHSSDVFNVVSNLAWMHMRDFRVDSAGGGGTIFQFGTLGTSKSTFDNLTLIQNVPNQAIFQSAFWLDNTIKSCNLFGAAGRSVPMIWLVSTSDNLGDNTFEDLTLTDAGSVSPSIAPATTWAIWLEEQSATLAYSNKFRGINFENCAGGALTLRGHINYLVESCEFWDLITPATNHLFYGAAGGVAGLPNRDGMIRKTVRCSGTLGGGICDIAFGPVGSEFNTVVREIHGTSLVQVIDLQHNIGCRIEDSTNIAAQSSYAPIYAVQAAAGTGAAAILDPNASNLYSAGCQVTTGTGPTAGDLVNVSANVNGWLTATPAAVMLVARNAAAATAGLYVSAQSATSFTVAAANAPSASTALKFSYNIVRAINGG